MIILYNYTGTLFLLIPFTNNLAVLVKLLDTVLWMLSVRKNKVGTRPQWFLPPERKCCVSVTIAIILGVLQCSLWVLTNFWHSTKMYIRYVPPSIREVGLIGVKWRFPSFNCRFYFSDVHRMTNISAILFWQQILFLSCLCDTTPADIRHQCWLRHFWLKHLHFSFHPHLNAPGQLFGSD